MDYGTVQTRVLNRLSMSSTDPMASLADEYANEALHMIETASPSGWPWMRRTITLTTTSGTGSYTFATLSSAYSISKILDCKILNGSTYYTMGLMSVEEAEQVYASTDTNQPEAFFVEGQTLYLYPTPDAAYTIQVRTVVSEADLGGSTSTPTLPVVFHTAWVEQTLALMYETLQDSERMDVANRRMENWYRRMSTYGREYQGAPPVRVREWL